MNSFYSLLKNDERFSYEEGLFYQTDFGRNNLFEENYIELRKKEERLYDDQVARRLPKFEGRANLSSEWEMRKQSTKRLIHHLQQKPRTRIMEIGCGNGWLIRCLQNYMTAEFLGIDINEYELKQAARISDSRSSCFLYGNVYSEAMDDLRADSIIVASAAHYFPDLKLFIQKLLTFLIPHGEIHLIDTPFYNEGEVKEAKFRSEKYFEKMQINLNNTNYYHHSLTALSSFPYKIAYHPNALINRVKRKITTDSPFPWIIITKK